jgi:hypothetical protein
LVIVTGTVPVLLTVTVFAALVVFTAWFEKATEAGDTVYVGTMTLPVSGIDCDTAGAATVILSVWLMTSGFVEVGRNVTLMVQVAPTAMGVLIVQLFVCANCPRFVPARLIVVMVNGLVPEFDTVTTWAVLA